MVSVVKTRKGNFSLLQTEFFRVGCSLDSRIQCRSLTAVESSWNVMAHGDAWVGKWRGNCRIWVGSQYPSHYLGTWCIQHYYRWCAHLGCASSRLNWRRPADLNVRNMFSVRVPSHFRWPLHMYITMRGSKNVNNTSLFEKSRLDFFGVFPQHVCTLKSENWRQWTKCTLL